MEEKIKKRICGLDMWNRWRKKDYQSRLYMDTWREREAGGGERRIWMDNVREDLKEKNIDLARIGEATRNREVWRSLGRASLSACRWRSEKKKKKKGKISTYS